MLQMQTHGNISGVHRLPAELPANISNNLFRCRIISRNEHGRLQIPVALVAGVLEILIAIDGESLDDLGFGYKVLDKFTAGDFIFQAVSQTGTHRVRAIHKDFPG